MDFAQLRYFIAVAEQLHFRKAAESLHLTQSALSQQIAKLESAYNLELFVRTGRTVKLTRAGMQLLRRARKVLAEVSKLEEELRALSKEGRVRIGYLDYQNLDFIHRALSTFSEEGATARIELLNLNADEIVEAVADGRVDLGVVHLPVKNGELQMTPLLKGRWGIVMPADHPLAAKQRIEPEDLDREKLLLFKRDLNPPVYDQFLSTLKKSRSKPKIALHLTQSAQGPKLVASGAGLYFVASYVVSPLPPHLVMRPYGGMSREAQLGLIWRKRPTQAIRLVIDEIKRQAKR